MKGCLVTPNKESRNYTYFYPKPGYIYFEHKEEGDYYAGGLWFDKENKLFDYDGVWDLDCEIIKFLESEGYNMDYAKDD